MEKHPDSTPKSVFLHLLMIGMLYISIIAVLVLAFQYSNVLFEDTLETWRISQYYEFIRWGSSVLLVAFPVLVLTTWTINKDLYVNPALRHRRERRWLMHFTLFLTAITIIIDLMVLIYNFYGGELTGRFALKVFAVLVVAAVTLGYYRWELKRSYSRTPFPKQATIAAGVVILAMLIAGFFIAGSPQEQRAVRMDDERVSDLQSIQSYISYHVENEGALPTELSELEYDGYVLPTDPETEESYEYMVVEGLTYELCATFETENMKGDGGASYNRAPIYEYDDPSLYDDSFWMHKAERTCFERTARIAEHVDEPIAEPATEEASEETSE